MKRRPGDSTRAGDNHRRHDGQRSRDGRGCGTPKANMICVRRRRGERDSSRSDEGKGTKMGSEKKRREIDPQSINPKLDFATTTRNVSCSEAPRWATEASARVGCTLCKTANLEMSRDVVNLRQIDQGPGPYKRAHSRRDGFMPCHAPR